MEVWKVIDRFPRYEVSTLGRVRSAKGVLKPILKKGTGYVAVTIRGKKREQIAIHTLVLEAFVGPRPAGYQACHENGKRDDPRLENLRWDTVKANHADRDRHGTTARGERAGAAKLTEKDVKEIRMAQQNQPALARKFGVSQVLISRVQLRKVWRHI